MSGPNFDSINLGRAISGVFTSRSNLLNLIDENKASCDLLPLESLMVSDEDGFEIPAGIAIIFTVEATMDEEAYTEDVFLEAPKSMKLQYVAEQVQAHIDSKPHKNGIHSVCGPKGY